MRDEFVLGEDGAVGPLIPKVYAEVLLERGRAFRSQLVEVEPEDDHRAAAMPASILDVLDRVRSRLPGTDSKREQEAQLEHESRIPESTPRP